MLFGLPLSLFIDMDRFAAFLQIALPYPLWQLYMSKEPLFIEHESPSPDCLPSLSCCRSRSRSPSPSPCRSSRPDNTLRALTERFVNLIQSSPNQTIEIDEASSRLAIQKRRIYDITNVLEGIGYIEKLGKNLMKWVGGVQGHYLEEEARRVEDRMRVVDRNHERIDGMIATFTGLLESESREGHVLNFICQEDIDRIMEGIELERMLVYKGVAGDRLAMEGKMDSRWPQCILENRDCKARLYHSWKGKGVEVVHGKGKAGMEVEEEIEEEGFYQEIEEDEEGFHKVQQ